MANDKKFIVKNGLLTPENAVIGSNTDTGEQLQVTGDTVLTQATAGTPTLKVTNTGGNNAVIGQFEGDSSALQVKNLTTGDYQLVNTGNNNGIIFFNDTGGISIQYNGGDRLVISNSGNEFTGLNNTTIDGNRILTTADEGSGNGLDADTVDGLEAAQFVRADVDDIMAGNYTIQNDLTIQGDLTVSGNTTTVNTEEILLADNIITINSNYTGSSPTEDGGIEVERGTLANAKVIWSESNDWWQLEVNGSVLGRIITTADEGPGNGFDADTVDGLEGSQFLRSDVDDTAAGNITIEGDLTIGDDGGPAQIFFDGQNVNRTLYSNNGEIGFLNTGANWAMKSDANGDLEVERDVEAGRDVLADNDVTAAQDITATSGNIAATAGNVTAGDSMTAQNNITATTGNVSATAGNVTAGNDVTAQNDITATTGDITASAGSVTAQVNVTATTGNVSATAGDVTAGDDVIAQNNITATTGNITASAGSVSAATTVTAGTDVIGQRFVDADNNSYFANPAGTSVFNDLGIDDDLFHNGDTDTKIQFTTDDISLQTGGSERLGVDNTGVDITGDLDVTGDISGGTGTFTGDVTAPRFVDADDTNYFADPAGSSEFHEVQIDDWVVHRGDTDTYFGFNAADNYQIFTGGTQRLEVNGTYITAAVDGIFPNLYAGRYYDSSNATYYGDFASTSRVNDISLVGEIIHDGDTNTYIHFPTNDQFAVVTNGSERLRVENGYVLANNQMRSQIFYDSNDTNYYLNPAGDSQVQEVHIDDWIRHRGDTNTYLGFPAADTIELTTGGGIRATINNTNATFNYDVLADRFVDRQSTGYYLNPADASLSATLNGSVRIANIADSTRYSDSTGTGGIVLAGDADIDASQSTMLAISGQYRSGAFALMYLNRIDANVNPFNAGNRYIEFRADGASGGAAFRGDSSGNFYLTPQASQNIGFWTSGGNEVAVALDDGNFVVGGSSVSYTSMDNTPLVGNITNNKLHVNGSIQLTSNDDAIVFGRGTSSFLKDEELGFGWGSGWYMTDASYLRVRNNTTVYSTGNADFNRFRSYQNTAYYVDPDGDSQLNTVDIDDYVRHRGDTNTFIGFPANDQIRLATNNNARLDITNSYVRARNAFQVYGSGLTIHKQSNGGGVGLEVSDNHGGELSYTQSGSIKFYHSDDSVVTGGDAFWYFNSTETDTYYVFGSQAGADGGTLVPIVDDTGELGTSAYRWNSAYITNANFTNVYASRYYDADDNTFYGDFNSRSEMNSVNLRHNSAVVAGNGNFNVASSVLGGLHFRNGNGVNGAPRMAAITFQGDSATAAQAGIYVSNDNSSGTHMAFAVTDNYSTGPQLTARFRNDGLFQTYRAYALFAGSARAPLFYDSDNTAFYTDPASTSQMNRIDIEDYIRHRNDTNTYFGFASNDTFRVWTNGTQRLNIDNNSLDSAVNVYAPRYYDSNATSRYIEPGGGGLLEGNFEFAASSTSTAYSTAAIELRESNFTGTAAATPPQLGFHWGGVVASNIAIEADGTIAIRNNPGNAYEKFRASEIRSEIYYDSNNTSYFINPAGQSTIADLRIEGGGDEAVLRFGPGVPSNDDAHIEWRGSSNGGHLRISTSDDAGTEFVQFGDYDNTNRGGAFTEWARFNRDYLYHTSDIRAPIFYDFNDTNWYGDFASTSRFNILDLQQLRLQAYGYVSGQTQNGQSHYQWDGAGFRNPGTYTTRFIIRQDHASAGVNNSIPALALYNHRGIDQATVSLVFASREEDGAGNAVNLAGIIAKKEGAGTNNAWSDGSLHFFTKDNGTRRDNMFMSQAGYVQSPFSFRAPIFYDSNNTGYYVDPASTSRFNTTQALRYYMNHGTSYWIDEASGNYGSIMTGGRRSGWAGYSIEGNWVFMGETNEVGIYNDIDNKWILQSYRNQWLRLYYNGSLQAQTASGYFLANNQMRAPIYYDSNNTAYFGHFDDRSRMRTLELGINALTSSGSYALGISHNNRYSIGFRNTNINGNYPWLVHDLYNFNGKGNQDAFIVHFNGIGDRLRLTESGDMLIEGEMAASNYNLSGGNENISLSKLYTRGAADETLFDGTMYFEKRVIKVMQGAENNTTADTNEFVKSTDAPGSSSYVLRTSAYRTFYSDYVEVEPGEEVFGEIHVKTISGSGGRLYYGIERFDKDKRPIAGNTGTTYFVVGGTIPTSTSWQTFRNHTTIPTSHTPYNGSDGGGVRYVRLRILYNYSSGGALREFTMPILKRTNYHSNVRTDYDVYGSVFRDVNNSAYYLDMDSVSYLNDIRPNIMYDRNDTNYYVNPATGFRLKGSNGSAVIQGSWPQLRIAQDDGTPDASINYDAGGAYRKWNVGPGAGGAEGDEFGFAIYSNTRGTHYGTPLRINALTGRVQVGDRDNPRYLLDVAGIGYAEASFRAPIFYDSDDTNYYINPNVNSILHNVEIRNFGLRLARNYSHNAIWFNGGTDQNHVLWNHYYGGPAGRGGAGSGGFDGIYWNTYQGIQIRGGSAGAYNIIRATNSSGNSNNHTVELYAHNVKQFETESGYALAPNQMRSPIYYDSNDTNYYANPASQSHFNTLTLAGNRLGFINTSFDAEIRVSDSNPDGTGADFSFFGDTGQYNARVISEVFHATRHMRAGIYYDVNDANYYLNPNSVSYLNDVRANIYYDRQDTGYYADPASTSRFNAINVNNIKDEASPEYGGLYFDARNGDYELSNSSTSYRSQKIGQGLAIYSGYSTGANRPFTYDMSAQFNLSSIAFEIAIDWVQGDRTPMKVRSLRDCCIGWSNWTDIATSGVSFTNNQDLRAPIFYDSNDTSYYANPNGNSRFNTMQFVGDVNFDGGAGAIEITSSDIRSNGNSSWTGNPGSGVGKIQMHSNRWYIVSNGNSNRIVQFRQNGSDRSYIANDGRLHGVGGTASQDWRAPIFYDNNDTGYYLDPNSTSNSALRIRGGALHGPNTTWGDYLAVGTNGHWSGSYASVATTNGNLHLDSRSGRDLYLQWYVGRTVFVSGAIQATIYYDRNNTSYYADMASTSYFNDFRANIMYDRENTAYYFGGSQGDASMRTVTVDRLNMRDRGDFITFYGDDSTYHSISSRDNGGGVTDDLRFNSYHDIFFNLDSNNNNSTGSTGFYVGQHGAATGGIQGWYFQAMCDGNSYASSSFRAPIFYDRNNTGYYVNPDSNSQLRAVYANDWFRAQGSSGFYFQDYGYGLRSAHSEGNPYGNVSTYNIGRNGWGGYGIGSRWTWMSTEGNNVGVHDNNRGWLQYYNGSYTDFNYGHVQSDSSFRAPIFYDLNNTGYYFDGASAHSTRFEGVNNRTMAWINKPGHTRNSGEYYRARPRQTSDTNYWTGAMGWGRVDMNVVSTWGSGFIDSWSNPPNQPSGTSHWVGCQAFHYRNSNTSGYGWQMVGGPITNLRFRSSWSGWRAWRTIPILDENSGNGGAMYAGIYYDSNDASYYANPNSTSRFYRQEIVNELHVSTGNGTGVGIRLADDGDIVDNNNGYCTMRFSSGVIIGNGNRSSSARHYLYSSGRLDSTSQMRAPIYYDRNSSGYYADPASTSRFNAITGNVYNSPYAGGNSGLARSSYPYSFGFQEGGGWSYPYPDLVLQFHTGMSFAGNPSYGGMRFFNDYNSGTVRFQINGGSSYTYANTWLRVAGSNQGIYSSHAGAHFEPNGRTSYGSWNIQGSRSGYYGISFHQPTWDPHLMFDGNGSGGIYMQGGGRWVFYHNRSNNCTGFGSSSTVGGYIMRVNGSLYCNGNIVAYSDERDKENIVTIDGALDKVLQLRGVYYERQTRVQLVDDRDEIYKGRQLGLIAQEVLPIVPEVVSYADELDQYGVDYSKMVGLLVEGIKDQHKIVEDQQKLINSQQDKIDKLEEMVYNIMNKMENK